MEFLWWNKSSKIDEDNTLSNKKQINNKDKKLPILKTDTNSDDSGLIIVNYHDLFTKSVFSIVLLMFMMAFIGLCYAVVKINQNDLDTNSGFEENNYHRLRSRNKNVDYAQLKNKVYNVEDIELNPDTGEINFSSLGKNSGEILWKSLGSGKT